MPDSQQPPGAGAARRGRPRQPERHGAGLFIDHDRQLDRSAARTAARSCSRCSTPLCDGPLLRARRGGALVSGATVRHGPRRVARRRGGRSRSTRDGATRIRRSRRPFSRRPGRSSCISRSATRTPDARRRRLARARDDLHRPPSARDVFSTDGRSMEEVVGELLVGTRIHDRGRGVVHGRPADVAADGRARQFRLRARGGRALRQRGEDDCSACPRALIDAARRGQRAGGGRDGGGHPRRGPAPTSRRRSPASRARWRHAGEAGRHRGHRCAGSGRNRRTFAPTRSSAAAR